MFPKWSLQIIAMLALVTTLSSCAQSIDEVNRVQPNHIKKSELLGREFYVRTTVVGTQFTSAYAFPGSMSSTARGVFEIQESAAVFYRTYEFIQGSEAYAMKADSDVPMKDKDGNLLKHAVLKDYQRVGCTPGEKAGVCGEGGWCADGANPQIDGESDHHGFCVQEATRYVYKGAPLFTYPISSHFDITYGYSAASGEKTNVKSENTSDRKWYERTYMRVDWGSGSTISYEADVLAGMLGAGQTPATIYEGDNAPEEERFEMGQDTRYGADVKQKYLTFINRYVLAAPSQYNSYYGYAIPICYYYPWYTGGVFDCVTEEVKVRTFFLEVPNFGDDPDRAYVARELDDNEFEKFGYFRTERQTYDPNYTKTFKSSIRRAQRHRVWDRYVKKFETAKDGRKVWTGDFDYSQMNPTPIVYYMNADHPRELVDASKDIATQWSVPFTEVVAFNKGDCGSATSKAEYDKCIKDNSPAFPMFILCESTDAVAQAAVDAGSPVAEWSGTEIGKQFCRNMDEPRKFGDLRYSTMHAVTDPIQIGLYGYGPSAADPLTGELMAGYAHSYVAQMKLGAERAMRTIEYTAGVKDFNDIKRSSEQVYLAEAKQLRSYGQAGPKSTNAAVAYVKDMIEPPVRTALKGKGLKLSDSSGTWAQGRMSILRSNPTLDAQLISGADDYAVHALFKDPSVAKGTASSVNKTQLDTMSVANWNHIAAYRSREKAQMELAKKNIMLDNFTDNAVMGVALEYGRHFDEEFCKKFYASEGTIYKWDELVSETETSAAGDCSEDGAFESLGLAKGRLCVTADDGKTSWAGCSAQVLMQKLRVAVNKANGGSPFAEPNKFLPSPLYTDSADLLVRKTQEIGRDLTATLRGSIKQDLWSRIYKGTQLHEVGHTVGLRHNFEASTDALNYNPEYWALKVDKDGEVVNPWQPDTTAQSLGHIRQHQLASVMDYTSKFNGRFGGLGLYDKAAIKFAYGDMVEVFNNPPDMDAAPSKDLPAMNDYLDEPSNTDASTYEMFHLGNSDFTKLTRKLHYSTLPKYFKGVSNMYDRRAVKWSQLKGNECNNDTDCQGERQCRAFGKDSYCTDAALTEVPYRFCSDEYNGRTPTCATFDEGADALEITRNALSDYENYWFFYGYAQDSVTYHPNRYNNSVVRYLWTATKQFKYWGVSFNHYNHNDWWKTKFGKAFDTDPNGGLSGALATAKTMNTLSQILARPSPGYYCYNSTRERYEPYDDKEGNQTDCRLFTELDGGRRLYPGWDSSGYRTRPVSGGQFYDRLTAFMMLTDPTPPRYMKSNPNEDIRRYLIGFGDFFPKRVMNLMSGWAVEEAKYFGWCVVNGGGDPTPDYLKRRHWVGGDQKACPDLCDSKQALKDQVGCTKYYLFPDSRPTFPSSRFRMPLLGALYGMSMLTDAFDRSFMDISRIFIKGHHSQIDVDDVKDVCTFTDPLSGKVYVSPKTSDEVLNPGCINLNAAQAVLDQFKDLETLQDNYLFSEYQFRVSLIEVQRALHMTYEY
ncbi:MAG TPA: hypothetical protein DCQ06_03795 [Myxococcales bacterium]|nr:hypothetical protein [Myxococcales bacterium]HAN30697.1 hypothetical protein [Myxococcales bacterium]